MRAEKSAKRELGKSKLLDTLAQGQADLKGAGQASRQGAAWEETRTTNQSRIGQWAFGRYKISISKPTSIGNGMAVL